MRHEHIRTGRYHGQRIQADQNFRIMHLLGQGHYRYAGLQEIQRASRERDMQFQRAASRPSGGGSGSGGNGRGQVAQHS